MKPFHIRPFDYSDADYEAFTALERAVWPEYPDTVAEWKHRDETRDPKYLFQRMVVEVEGRMVASGLHCEPWWSFKPGKYFVNISVHPDYRRSGIGTALYDYAMAQLAPLEPITIAAHTREDRPDGVRFLAKRGFVQQMRAPVSHLDVEAFDPTPFAAKIARVEASGIRILPLRRVRESDPDWEHKFWELDWELLQDVPFPDPFTRLPFEDFRTRVLNSPGFNPDGIMIALDGDHWVGMSGLWMAQGDPELLYTGLTGVVRSHRRRGIATAMKVRALAFARAYGARIVETDNEENNPMYFLNLQLGFEPQPALLDFAKQMREEPEQGG